MKLRQSTFILMFILFNFSLLSGQIGALGTFDFLNLSQSARTTGIGSYSIAVYDNDIAQGFANPALINDSMEHHLSINHNFHLADITHGFVSYAIHLDKPDLSLMGGITYVNYGSFIRSDVFGNQNGVFNASENAVTFGLAKQIDQRLRAGINIKFANSNLDTYSSTALGIDFGFYYANDENANSWALVLKNIGWQLSQYNNLAESLPFDLQFGFSKRLKYLPFRFMITAHNLHKWNLLDINSDSSDPIIFGASNNSRSSLSKGVDNLFRHLAFGGEFYIGKNEIFNLRLGYNHLRNKDLSVSGFRSFSGFSFGLGIRIKKIKIDYGLGRYHLAGGMNHLSLSIDLNSIFRKI